MEETISLKELFDTLKKRIWMIISITILAVVASAVYTFYAITPTYQTQTQVLVSQQATGAASLAAMAFDSDAKYIDTYNVIMKSPYILNQVIEELALERSHRALNSQISVAQEGRSQVVTIRVTDTDPAMAVEIANTTARVFQREVYTLMRVDNVHVLSPAELEASSSPINPKPNLNMAIAFVVGLMAAIGLAFLLEFLDNTLRTEQDVEDTLGLPILGVIPVIEHENETKDKSSPKNKLEKIS